MSNSLALFAFIDALGWEILRRHSFLADEIKFQQPMDTIFGYSSTCDPTIITGAMPCEHGHFAFFTHVPRHCSPFKTARLLSLLPASITRRGRVRHWLSRLYARYLRYTGYFQLYNMPFRQLTLFDYTEKRDIYAEGGINGGQPSIFVLMRRRGVPFFLADWRSSEETNLAALQTELSQGRISFAYLYLAAMDAILHADGTSSARVSAKIAWYERELRELLRVARARYDQVRLYVFSDHGMTDIIRHCDLISRIAALPLRFGRDYVAAYDSTMARFWFLRPHARALIEEALQAESSGIILSDATLRAWGCDFPGQRYGELFFLLDPGVLLLPSFMGEHPLAGMHGYDPRHRDSTASFLSNVTPPIIPRRLDDMFRLMLIEAGLNT